MSTNRAKVWTGLRKLAGLAPAGNTQAADGDSQDEQDEGEADGEDAGEGNTDEQPQPGEGEGEPETPPQDDEGAGGNGEGDEGEADEGEDDTEDRPGPQVNAESADYRAGVAATDRKWATVLSADACVTNLRMATDLLAEGMSPERVIEMCEQHGSTNQAVLELLDRTPKPNLGAEPDRTGGSAKEAGDKVRSKAAARVNARVGARGKKAMAAAAAAGSKK